MKFQIVIDYFLIFLSCFSYLYFYLVFWRETQFFFFDIHSLMCSNIGNKMTNIQDVFSNSYSFNESFSSKLKEEVFRKKK